MNKNSDIYNHIMALYIVGLLNTVTIFTLLFLVTRG